MKYNFVDFRYCTSFYIVQQFCKDLVLFFKHKHIHKNKIKKMILFYYLFFNKQKKTNNNKLIDK